MAFTKLVSKHDRIDIDGTDVSNAFSAFGLTSSRTVIEAGGFSVSGTLERLGGAIEQGFTGTMFMTEEILDIVLPIHFSGESVEIEWQPNGLVDSTATVYYGVCEIVEVSPLNTFNQVSTATFNAVISSEDGIQYAAGT